jgi:hypothetical protein
MLRAIFAEFIKAKHSFAVWLSLFGTLANVLLFFSLHWLNPGKWRGEGHWEDYILNFYEGVAFMMLPLYVVILAALVSFMEHRRGMWTHLFVLPLNRSQLYVGKLIYLLFHFLAAHLLFILGMLASGYLLGWLDPSYHFWEDRLPVFLIGTLAAKTFLSILGLLSLQYWLSLRFNHFIIPLTIGILGFVAVALLGADWPHISYIPFAPPVLYMQVFRGELILETWGPFSLAEVASMGFFLLFLIIGLIDFSQKRV